MANTTKSSGYSATNAPENREHVESTASYEPNRPRRPEVEVGMEALRHETVPSEAHDLDQTGYGSDRRATGRERVANKRTGT